MLYFGSRFFVGFCEEICKKIFCFFIKTFHLCIKSDYYGYND